MDNLMSVYLAVLNNMWDVENQLILELPKMAAFANNEHLKQSITAHLEETRSHKIRLEELLQHHGKSLTYERDVAFETLLKDAASDLAFIEDKNVRDVFLIASAQTVEHIEISRYASLLHWARVLKDELGSTLLLQTLDEERNASTALSSLSEGDLFGLGLDEKAAESGITPMD